MIIVGFFYKKCNEIFQKYEKYGNIKNNMY